MPTKRVTQLHKPSRICALYLGIAQNPELEATVNDRCDDTRILAEEMAGEYGRSRAYWLGLVTGGDQ